MKIDPLHIREKLPEKITLIAVSKNQPDEKIDAALAAGFRQFGENRVQEAQRHWQEKRALYPDLVLHLIGPLQSNKAGDAVALFDVIQTLDRPKIAEALRREMERQGRDLPCFIQVNIGDEPQKAGIAVADLPEFYRYCTETLGLSVVGLMAIPPFDQPATPFFQRMRHLADTLGLTQLSMGMSDDYPEALDCGATHIRIGTALFGQR